MATTIKQQEVIELVNQGLPFKAIARRLGIAEMTARTRYDRGMRALRATQDPDTARAIVATQRANAADGPFGLTPKQMQGLDMYNICQGNIRLMTVALSDDPTGLPKSYMACRTLLIRAAEKFARAGIMSLTATSDIDNIKEAARLWSEIRAQLEAELETPTITETTTTELPAPATATATATTTEIPPVLAEANSDNNNNSESELNAYFADPDSELETEGEVVTETETETE